MARPIHQRRLPPPPPVFPFYNYPYPPMGHMAAPPPPPTSSWFVPPPRQPIPYWDEDTCIYIETLPPLSSFHVPLRPPPPSPFWDNIPIYTQTMHPPHLPPPPSQQEDLDHKILTQIEYYFSDDNLAKDAHLKMKMDDNGWVPITLIAGFRRVSQMTNDIQFIKDSLKISMTVEVEGDKVRRRDNWKKWLLPREFRSEFKN